MSIYKVVALFFSTLSSVSTLTQLLKSRTCL